jgi:hypothetical protein
MDGTGELRSSGEEQHRKLQTQWTEQMLSAGPRRHTRAADPLTLYLVGWRLKLAMRKVFQAAGDITNSSSVLVLCAAEGYEGTLLMDMGLRDVTVSDLSDAVAEVAVRRDPRLKARALNAEETGLPARSYDIVVVQDGLHHLQRPVQGFTEMLRIASRAVIFLEPHDSPIGRLIGTRWERNGPAVNYVFRWTRRMVGDVASSYLGQGASRNLSFSFFHHNVVLAKAGRWLGSGAFAVACIASAKACMGFLLPGMGNQFCGLVILNRTGDAAG